MGAKDFCSAIAGLKSILPKLDDPELERQYVSNRVKRKWSMLCYTSAFYCAVNLIWIMLPRGEMDLRVFGFYRFNGLASSLGYFLTLSVVGRYPNRKWLYDCAISAWGIHFLSFNSFTRTNVYLVMGLDAPVEIHDQGYQLLVCSAWIAGFLAHTEIDLRCLIVVIHCGMGAWMTLGICMGTGGGAILYAKMSLVYYALCLLIWEQSRRAQKGNRAMWLVQKQLERQVEVEREAVHAKVSAAEEVALYSFMVAVFDIFGHLEWKAPSPDAKPQFCFEEKPNVNLNELVGRRIEGQSLEALLGNGDNEQERRGERQRLWEYAAVEATNSSSFRAARKIGLTCVHARGIRIEVELFIRPTDEEKAIFGLLILNNPSNVHGGAVGAGHGVISAEPQRLQKCIVGARSRVASSSTSSCSSARVFPLPLGEPNRVLTWVDAEELGLPIMTCSSATVRCTTYLGGPIVAGSRFLDLLEDSSRVDFGVWLQNRLNELRAIMEIASEAMTLEEVCRLAKVGNNSFPVVLQHMGSSGVLPLELRAECQLDVEASLTQNEDDSGTAGWPVLLILVNMTEHQRNSRHKRMTGARV